MAVSLGLGVRNLFTQLQSRFPDLQLDVRHRNCVIDALARVGLLDDAVDEARSLEDNSIIAWTSVMGGARTHNRLDIGALALNEIRRLNPKNTNETLAPACVLMAHLFTKHSHHEEAAQLRRHMKDEGIRKIPGESSIEVNGVVHTFRVGTSHPEMKQIIALNDELHERLREQGYRPDVEWVDRGADTSDHRKERLLCEHSERLALVYGLLHSKDNQQPLTLFKNLRVCGDCHNATKHVSKLLSRTIVVKDANRWHIFENGKCSCCDFW